MYKEGWININLDRWDLIYDGKKRMPIIENRILRRIFGPKKDVHGKWWLQNEELHSLYRSANIVRVIKSTRLRWAGDVARMEQGRSVSQF